MSAPTTPEQAVCAKLLTVAGFTAVVGDRITPQVGDQEPVYPLAVYARGGSDQPLKLTGASGLSKIMVDVTVYAENEEDIHAAGVAMVAALQEWRDPANRVQGCFHVDSNTDAELEVRNIRHTFAVWWKAA